MKLQATLEMQYMRTGLKIGLEPDAFFRLANELLQKSPMTPISPQQFNTTEIKLAGPSGYITIAKDESLGKSGYQPIYVGDE